MSPAEVTAKLERYGIRPGDWVEMREKREGVTRKIMGRLSAPHTVAGRVSLTLTEAQVVGGRACTDVSFRYEGSSIFPLSEQMKATLFATNLNRKD